MSLLFVIEAPFKAKALETILRDIGIDAKVQATKGHLYAMPDKLTPLGIDAGFREFGRKLLDEEIGQRIRDAASEADAVYVATDADQEGDVIAWDVAELISDLQPEPFRVRLKGMDEDSVRSALDETVYVRKRDAVAGRTRAIIDRMIGSVFSTDGVAVGRVSTALLGVVRDAPPKIHRLRLVAPSKDGGRPWTAETDVVAPLDAKTADRLVKVRFPPMGLMSSSPSPIERRPGNMGDIMVRAGDELDMSPKEASNSLQKLYEAGRMSYPRAGSRGISKGILRKIHGILQKSGYEFDADKVSDKKSGDVHDAPYPIGPVEVHKDPARQGFEEGIRTLAARDILRAGQTHTVQIGVGETAGKHLSTIGFSQKVCDFVARLEWRREEGPRYPGQESWPKSELLERRQDTALLESAVRLGLGRPSTWASQIEKFFDRGLVDGEFNLTKKGMLWVDASPEILLNPKVSAFIEEACEKHVTGMMDDPSREPWEILAEKIVSVLPDALKVPLQKAVEDIEPHPKPDPLAPYRKTSTLDDILAASKEHEHVYAPPMPDMDDW